MTINKPLLNLVFLQNKLKDYKQEIQNNSQIFLKWHEESRKEEERTEGETGEEA